MSDMYTCDLDELFMHYEIHGRRKMIYSYLLIVFSNWIVYVNYNALIPTLVGYHINVAKDFNICSRD